MAQDEDRIFRTLLIVVLLEKFPHTAQWSFEISSFEKMGMGEDPVNVFINLHYKIRAAGWGILKLPQVRDFEWPSGVNAWRSQKNTEEIDDGMIHSNCQQLAEVASPKRIEGSTTTKGLGIGQVPGSPSGGRDELVTATGLS